MLRWMQARQVTVVIALVGALLLGGATAVLAAQSDASPGATHRRAGSSNPTETARPHATSESNSEHDQDDNGTEQHGQTLLGVIQSVSIDAQSFVFLPDGQQKTLTIAFDPKTEIEREQGSSPLVAGGHVTIEVVKLADGFFYAAEIRGDHQGGDDQGDDSGEDGHQGQPTSTPGAGEHG